MNFNLNDVSYSTKLDFKNETINFSVENPRKLIRPESVYKYYSLNAFSVSALINHYLFSAHPLRLNDKYDCTGDLIDYSDLSLDTYINFLSKDLKLFSEEKIRELYSPEKRWVLDRTVEI